MEDVINENLVSVPSALSTGRSGVCREHVSVPASATGHADFPRAVFKSEPFLTSRLDDDSLGN